MTLNCHYTGLSISHREEGSHISAGILSMVATGVMFIFSVLFLGIMWDLGSTTFLLVVPAPLPIYEKLGMSGLVLTCVTAMGAGTMNIAPWGNLWLLY